MFQINLLVFNKQLVSLIDSGFTIYESILEMSNNGFTKDIKIESLKIKTCLDRGSSFSESIETINRIDKDYIRLISIGETTGNMEDILNTYINWLEDKKRVKDIIIKSITYPLFLLVSIFILIGVITKLIIPIFIDLYNSNNIDIPSSIYFFLSFNIIKKYIIIFAIILWIIDLYMKRSLKYKDKYIYYKSKYILKIPIVGKIISFLNFMKFFSVLKILVKSGMPIVSSLEDSIENIGNGYIKNNLKKQVMEIKKGKYVSESLGQIDQIPSIYIKILKTGEITGRFSKSLDNIDKINIYKINIFLEKFNSFLEPALILFIASIIGLLIAVVIPPLLDFSLYL